MDHEHPIEIFTERLIVRSIRPTDAGELGQLQWLGAPGDASPSRIVTTLGAATGSRVFGVRTRDGVRVGALALTAEPAGELGIACGIAVEQIGHGYAREALAALCRWACDAGACGAVARLVIRCAADDVRGAQLARAAGFVRTEASGAHHVWSATPAWLGAWESVWRACVATGETLAEGAGGVLRVDGELELVIVELDGGYQVVATADVADTAAFTPADSLRHNATLAIGALCVADDRLCLRYVGAPVALTSRGLALLIHEAARLRSLTRAVVTAHDLEAFAHYAA